jgi:hypothetical protein
VSRSFSAFFFPACFDSSGFSVLFEMAIFFWPWCWFLLMDADVGGIFADGGGISCFCLGDARKGDVRVLGKA